MSQSPFRSLPSRLSLRSLSVYPLAAAAIAFAAACTQSDPEGGTPKTENWYGLARNSCGPADGPAIDFVLDSLPYSDCSARHDGEQGFMLDGKLVDELAPSQVVVDTQSICAANQCQNGTVYTLEILSADSTLVKAAFRIESQQDGIRKTLRSGKVTLAKCRPPRMCG